MICSFMIHIVCCPQSSKNSNIFEQGESGPSILKIKSDSYWHYQVDILVFEEVHEGFSLSFGTLF